MAPRDQLTVVVTRSEAGGGPLAAMLEDRGAKVLLWPTVRYEDPDDPEAFDDSINRLDDYGWVVFSSPRTVKAVVRRRSGVPQGPRIAAVGPATAASLEAAGWPVDLVPETFSAEALVEGFKRWSETGIRVLFPASDIARPTIAKGLGALGYEVDQVVAYRTVESGLDRETCLNDVGKYRPDFVTFASPSAAVALHRVLGADDFKKILETAPAVAIGPVTAESLVGLGCPPAETASHHTISGLVDAVETAFDRLINS